MRLAQTAMAGAALTVVMVLAFPAGIVRAEPPPPDPGPIKPETPLPLYPASQLNDWFSAGVAVTGPPDVRVGLVGRPTVKGLPNPYHFLPRTLWDEVDLNPGDYRLPDFWLPPGRPDIGAPLPVIFSTESPGWGVVFGGDFIPLPAPPPRP